MINIEWVHFDLFVVRGNAKTQNKGDYKMRATDATKKEKYKILRSLRFWKWSREYKILTLSTATNKSR